MAQRVLTRNCGHTMPRANLVLRLRCFYKHKNRWSCRPVLLAGWLAGAGQGSQPSLLPIPLPLPCVAHMLLLTAFRVVLISCDSQRHVFLNCPDHTYPDWTTRSAHQVVPSLLTPHTTQSSPKHHHPRTCMLRADTSAQRPGSVRYSATARSSAPCSEPASMPSNVKPLRSHCDVKLLVHV
jgi:hypothetical protein